MPWVSGGPWKLSWKPRLSATVASLEAARALGGVRVRYESCEPDTAECAHRFSRASVPAKAGPTLQSIFGQVSGTGSAVSIVPTGFSRCLGVPGIRTLTGIVKARL